MFYSFSLLFHVSTFTLRHWLESVHTVLLVSWFFCVAFWFVSRNRSSLLQVDDQTRAKIWSKYAHFLLIVLCTTGDLFWVDKEWESWTGAVGCERFKDKKINEGDFLFVMLANSWFLLYTLTWRMRRKGKGCEKFKEHTFRWKDQWSVDRQFGECPGFKVLDICKSPKSPLFAFQLRMAH